MTPTEGHVEYAHHTFIQRVDHINEVVFDRPVWVPCCAACGQVYTTYSQEDAERWATEHDAGAPINPLFVGLEPGMRRPIRVEDDGGWTFGPDGVDQ